MCIFSIEAKIVGMILHRPLPHRLTWKAQGGVIRREIRKDQEKREPGGLQPQPWSGHASMF